MTSIPKFKSINDKIVSAYQDDPEIAAIYLFGSVVLENVNALSDIDLAVLFEEQVPKSGYFTRRLSMIPEMQSLLHFSPVELIILNNAPLVLGHRVIARGKILLENNPQFRVRFETRLLSRYLDFLPVLKIHRQYVRKQIAAEPPLD